MNAGFILLYRQITEWEWYQNPNTFRVFLHCLLKANFTDGRFEGQDIKRGQFVTSLDHLSKETKLSVKEVRTALTHLIGTGELASESCSRYRVITVVKYNEYQDEGKQNGKQGASEGQARGKQGASKGQQYNNNNNGTMEKRNNDYQLLADDDASEIQRDHDRVLDAAEDAGFKMTNNVRASLIALYADNGLEKVLAGIRSCSEHGATTLAYLRACLKDEPKKVVQAKQAVPAQAYTQRSYDGEQEAAMKRMLRVVSE